MEKEGLQAATPDAAPAQDVTWLLAEARSGNGDAESRLLSLVYDDLRRLARKYRRNERHADSLNTTALVHEAYLALAPGSREFADRIHFFAMAARVMRHVLVDHARSRVAQKHGGGVPPINLDDIQIGAEDNPENMIELDRALLRLREFAPRQEKVVELRFFSGMSEAEIAEHLAINVRTVRRDWNVAKAWLFGELKHG